MERDEVAKLIGLMIKAESIEEIELYKFNIIKIVNYLSILNINRKQYLEISVHPNLNDIEEHCISIINKMPSKFNDYHIQYSILTILHFFNIS